MALEAVQAQAGHRSIESTRVYLASDWLAGEYRRAAANRLAAGSRRVDAGVRAGLGIGRVLHDIVVAEDEVGRPGRREGAQAFLAGAGRSRPRSHELSGRRCRVPRSAPECRRERSGARRPRRRSRVPVGPGRHDQVPMSEAGACGRAAPPSPRKRTGPWRRGGRGRLTRAVAMPCRGGPALYPPRGLPAAPEVGLHPALDLAVRHQVASIIVTARSICSVSQPKNQRKCSSRVEAHATRRRAAERGS